MKVIYAVNSDLGKHGAIGIRTFHVAKEAYKKGYLKKIICRGDSQKYIPKKYIEKIFPFYRIVNLGLSFVNQFIFKNFPARKMQLYLFDFLVSRKLKKSDIKADVLHIYEYAPKSIKQAKDLGMKVVLDTQMPHPRTSEKIFNLKKRFYKGLTKCLKLADKVIVSSDFEVQSWTENGVPKEKIELIPLGVDFKKFSSNKRKKTKEFICLFVGIIEPRKGVSYLLKAWEELNLKDSKLILCGRINKTMDAEVRRYAKNKTIGFKGFVDPAPYYQNADLFVFPSLFEGSGKVLFEAMAAGLPIVTTFNSGPVFKDGEGGFIIPIKDVKSIKEKILYLKNNPAEAKELGEMGKRMAKKLTWELYGRRFVNECEKLFKKR